MRVLYATAEVYPLAKTGGLADVSRGFTLALKRRDIDVQLIVPGYPEALENIERPETITKLAPALGVDDATLVRGLLPRGNTPVWLVNAPSLFRRSGGPYQDARGRDWTDNAIRFAFFARAAYQLATGQCGGTWLPDVVHANDWHAGLLPLLLTRGPSATPGTMFTVHNMAFQGNFPRDVLPLLNLPDGALECIDFHGQVSFMKAGISCADRVTTVSPTYAKELLTPEQGCGMDGILRSRGEHFSGILNGIEETYWNPATDPWLPCRYNVNDRSGKSVCKLALQRHFGLSETPEPVVLGFVSRLTTQKMADVILDAMSWLADRPLQLVLMGKGDRQIELGLLKAAWRHKGRLSVKLGYDEGLAHLLIAGSDILLTPARFEPCGLAQLYAFRYGTLPVVRRTGGLADTVTDVDATSLIDSTASGFVFDEPTTEALCSAITRAVDTYHNRLRWQMLQRNVMCKTLGWNSSMGQYISLYDEISGTRIDHQNRVSDDGVVRQTAS